MFKLFQIQVQKWCWLISLTMNIASTGRARSRKCRNYTFCTFKIFNWLRSSSLMINENNIVFIIWYLNIWLTLNHNDMICYRTVWFSLLLWSCKSFFFFLTLLFAWRQTRFIADSLLMKRTFILVHSDYEWIEMLLQQ